MMLTCYPSPGKVKAHRICRSFRTGCIRENVKSQIASTRRMKIEPGAAFFYGWTEHTVPLIRQCQRECRDWYYADNAYYFGRGDYFRVTRNALMHDGSGQAGPDRFNAFGLTVKPWRRDGAHVVITTQSEAYFQMRLGLSRDDWVAKITEELKRVTDRKIVVCHKPAPPWKDWLHQNFEDKLPGAWAVVSHSSSTMVKAVLDGIPVFSVGQSMASRIGLKDLSLIEQPIYPERDQWLWNLAANQWTYEEMFKGRCWRDLNS